MTKRRDVNEEAIQLIQNEEWLRQKIEEEGYSSSRLAKELGIYRASVERYRVKFGIEQKLTQKELTTKNYQHKTEQQKRSILNKRKQTNIELYGAENTFQSHKDIIEQTMIEKYGVTRALQHPDFISKRQTTMVERYGVVFTAQLHLSSEVIQVLRNREWLIQQHHNQKKTLKQISTEIGVDPSTIERACWREGVEIKYYFESAQQREISDWLSSLNIQVHTNNRNKIKNQELDIYLPEYNLAIEYCGVYWHSDAHDRMTPTYHRDKMRKCNEVGIRLLTIFEDEWVYKKEIVKQKILSILGRHTKSVFARKCVVVPIQDKELKTAFFDAYHIQGTGPGSITYGLVYDNNLVAMMTFIQRKDGMYELNRYATSVRVVGGFQKLLKHFKGQHPDWTEILSFADLRWSQGNMYNVSGFRLDKVLHPDYRYVLGNMTFHKFGFRRRALLGGKIPNFDPTLSEVQNMRNAGYYRIFNCGLLRYTITR